MTIINQTTVGGGGSDGAPRTLRLAFLADTGKPTEGLLGGATSPLGTMLNRWNPDRVLLAGDCRYPESSYAAANTFLNGRLNHTIACVGNHDLDGDNGAAFHAFYPHGNFATDLPGCWNVTLGDNFCDVIVINDGLTTSRQQMHPGGISGGSPLEEWFAERCTALTAPHRLVMVHHPLFTVAQGGAEHAAEMAWLTKPAYRVSAILSGHTHLSKVGFHRGVLCLNASATARLDGALTSTLQGAATDATLEWVETETTAACLLTLTETGLTYQFWDQAENLRHAGSTVTNVALQVLDADVIAPGVEVTNGEYYVCHAPAGYYLDAVRFSFCTPLVDTGAALITLEFKVDGVSYATGAMRSGSMRISPSPGLVKRMILPGQRLTVAVSHAPLSYMTINPQKGLRISQLTRLISY